MRYFEILFDHWCVLNIDWYTVLCPSWTFRDGIRSGHGIYTFTSGNMYIGQYKDGKENGLGTYKYADGRVVKGIFKDRDFVG